MLHMYNYTHSPPFYSPVAWVPSSETFVSCATTGLVRLSVNSVSWLHFSALASSLSLRRFENQPLQFTFVSPWGPKSSFRSTVFLSVRSLPSLSPFHFILSYELQSSVTTSPRIWVIAGSSSPLKHLSWRRRYRVHPVPLNLQHTHVVI